MPSSNVSVLNQATTDHVNTELFQLLSTAVVLCTSQGVIVEINAAANSVLGMSFSAGDNLFQRLNKDGQLYPVIQRALDEPQSFLIRELEFGRINPQQPASLIFDCLVNSDIGLDKNGEQLILLELHDRERHKQIREENELWEQQAITKKITRQLAHEIKNPLAGIRGAAQLLEKQLVEKKQHAFTQLIINEVDRLATLADNLLGPEKAPIKKPQNIHAVLLHVIQLIKSVSVNKSINVKADFDPSLPEINIDRNQLIQVFLNLAQNAMQAMLENKTEQPNLIVRTRILNHYTLGKIRHKMVLAINFIDNGPGVNKEIEEHLFYPLVTSRAAGTGLGLAISQLIVQRHDGLIEYQRNTKEQTEFTVLIPYN